MFSARTTSNGGEHDLGERVRALRHDRGLTLKGLGRLAGLSHPFLSQVERGLAQPSVSSIERIAEALGVPVAQLWAPPRRRDTVTVVRRDEGETIDSRDASVRALPGAPGVLEWSGGSRRWPAELDVRSGDVLVYVARGAVEVDLDGSVYALAEGDSMRFDGEIPHRMRRSGPTATRALIILSD